MVFSNLAICDARDPCAVPSGRVRRMLRFAGFPLSAWAFALRTWAAMMLALYVAFWLQLENGYIAAFTVGSLPADAGAGWPEGTVPAPNDLCWRCRLPLERVHGKVDSFDRLERVSSQTLLDLLEVPQRNRTAGTFRRVAKVMAELGWTAVRMRDLTRGGYREQIRGYCRHPRNMQAGH